jgi:hypothetical protein
MPFIHLYRVGERECEGIHEEVSRVSVFSQGDIRFANGAPSLVLGTMPEVEVIPLHEVNWFWIEAN